jgi:antirestriction protein ArdC
MHVSGTLAPVPAPTQELLTNRSGRRTRIFERCVTLRFLPIAASGADFRIGGERAFYSPDHDFIQVPRPEAYFEPINWHRTAVHELGHNAEPSVMPRRSEFPFKTRPDRRCHAA